MASAKPFIRKGKYNKNERSMMAGGGSDASSRGVGGSLLLGFSTCKLANWDGKGAAAVEGETYVVPVHRLRAVHHATNKLVWSFEPIIGTQSGGTDLIIMDIDQGLSTQVWDQIATIIAGTHAGDTFVWIQNACSRGATMGGAPVVVPNVTDVVFDLSSIA